ncbi:ATP-binding protein [Nonomuraea sp. NPDC050536]|uniref:ATP-binding protein n=1 Tax=Nonomuraea sp. NPDC050536 TaxID=3364366 RepID=UPI0037C8807A
MNQPAVMDLSTPWQTDSPPEQVVGSFQEPSDHFASWPLTPATSSVPLARRLTRDQLAAWGLDGLGEVAELLVSELVTNALCHAHGPYRLSLWAIDGLLRCEVEDGYAAPPHVRHPCAEDENGRGMNVLELMACCWGSERTPEGKIVWFEFPAG